MGNEKAGERVVKVAREGRVPRRPIGGPGDSVCAAEGIGPPKYARGMTGSPVNSPDATALASGSFDVIVIGGGASGMVAAISAARLGRSVLLCEKSNSLGRKLLASGGERCNLSNTLSKDEFMERVGRNGRFMGPALDELGGPKLREFFHGIGVPTVVHDGFRVWPETRKSKSVLAGLVAELERLEVPLALECAVEGVEFGEAGFVVRHGGGRFLGDQLVIATGGLALPRSGASGGGYAFAEGFGHRVTPRLPAGVPVVTAEDWTGRCTAHTIGKAQLRIVVKKPSKQIYTGDLIFTKQGLRGPVVLDMSREISAMLEKHEVVPLEMNLCRGRNQEDWQGIFKAWAKGRPGLLLDRLGEVLPRELCEVMCELSGVPLDIEVHRLAGAARDALIRTLVKTPITVTGTTGFEGAFVTRGGVHLKEVRPETLESKKQPGLFLCGEVLDLDGPCGGFNLQWAFASGFLAGQGRGVGGERVGVEVSQVSG